jgi:uncharacterized cupredoxin-like copper-binding protein
MVTGWRRALLLVPLLLAAGLLMACGGDDDEDDAAEMDMAEDQMVHKAEPGVVSAKPADATQVGVTLREWAITPGQLTVTAGTLYFLVENAGPEHPHELVIIRSDLGPLELPFADNKVPEEQVDVVAEIEEYAPDSSASLTVELAAGKYLLICNITEEDEAIGSHYKRGMVAILTVG